MASTFPASFFSIFFIIGNFGIGLIQAARPQRTTTSSDISELEKHVFDTPELIMAVRRGDFLTLNKLLEEGTDTEVRDLQNQCRTPLIVAVDSGNVDIVRLLLNRGANVNATDRFGLSPLAMAAQRSAAPIVRVLLQNRADVNAKSRDLFTFDWSPIAFAIATGRSDIVDMLLDANIDIDQTYGKPGKLSCSQNRTLTLLALAATMTDVPSSQGSTATVNTQQEQDANNGTAIAVAKSLIDHGFVLAKSLVTPLMAAAEASRPAIVSFLLERGIVDIDAVDDEGKTALMYAVSACAANDPLSVVKILLQNNANVNLRSKNGLSALFLAAKNGFDDAVDLLLSRGAITSSNDDDILRGRFLSAAQRGNITLMTSLLQDSKNAYLVGVQDVERANSTALILAAQKGNAEPLRGPPTPMNRMSSGRYVEVISLLMQKQANVDATTSFGKTALMMAIELGFSDVVGVLSAKTGFDSVGLLNSRLIYAVQFENTTAVSELLSQGAEVNAKSASGTPALIAAVKSGNVDVVPVLLQMNATDVNAKDSLGQTALIAAALYQRLAVIKMLLLRSDTDVNAVDNVGSSAIHWTAINQQAEVTALLMSRGAESCSPTSSKSTRKNGSNSLTGTFYIVIYIPILVLLFR